MTTRSIGFKTISMRLSELQPLRSGGRHLDSLTSIRGVACLVVLFGHVVKSFSFATESGSAGAVQVLLHDLFNGDAAVRLFFVLSGCVLALSLRNTARMDAQAILGFYIKRAFRIYPALWVSLPLGILSVLVLRPIADDRVLAEWLLLNLKSPVELHTVLTSLAGLYTRLNGPMWSLRVELAWSLLFPPIFVLVRHPGTRWLTVAAMLLVAVIPTPYQLGLSFGFAFALGASIPFLRIAAVNPAGVLLAAVVLLSVRDILHLPVQEQRYLDIIESGASFVIILGLYHGKAGGRVLDHWIAVRLGEWSYSIYLFHLPMLLLAFYGMVRVLGTGPVLAHPLSAQAVLALAAILPTLVMASLGFRYCEIPMQQLGRALAKKLARIDRRPMIPAGQPVPPEA